MPGLDRTGPGGQGSRTGRGLGRCNPDLNQQNHDNSSENSEFSARPGFGFGRNMDGPPGRGRGRQRRWRFGRT